MGIIVDVMTGTTTVLEQHVVDVFKAVGPAMKDSLKAAGAVGLIFVAINHMFNISEVKYSDYIKWLFRFSCIYSIALTWENFEIFYNLFVSLPSEYASSLITATKLAGELELCVPKGGLLGFGVLNTPTIIDIGSAVGLDGDCSKIEPPTVDGAVKDSVFSALDQFSETIFSIGTAVMKEFVLLDAGTYKYILAGVMIYVVGLLFTGYALVVMLMAEIGFTIAMSLAPLAISMLVFNQTRSYFENWLRLTAGFAIVKLLASAIMAVIITVAYNMKREDDFFGGYLPFVLVSLAAWTLLQQVPGLASTLASTSLPAMGPGAVKDAVSGPVSAMKSPLQMASAIGNRSSAAKNAFQIARAGGGGPAGAVFAGLKAMSQSAQFRAEKSNRMAYQRADLKNALNKNKKSDNEKE